MKIISVNITAFGKLKNVAFNFGDGVNILQQANGFGKSTLCAFIRAMLYGLNYSYKLVDGVRTNDVTRYMPWDSTQKFGGSMQIADQGKTYRIERFFGNTQRAESLQVVDISTGRQVDIANVGEHFLGLTAESYDRSTYIPQEYVEISSNENFDAKLANFVQDSAESYDDIQAKLRAYKKQFKFERGTGGEIFTLEDEILKLQSQLQQAENDANNRTRMAQELKQTELALQQIDKEQQALQLRLDSLQQSLYQAKPSPADVERAQKIDELDMQIASVPQSVTQDYNNFAKLLDEQKALEKKHNPLAFKRRLIGISLALSVVLAVVLAILEQYVLMGVSAVVAVALTALLLLANGKKNANKLDQLQTELESIASKYVNPNGKSFDELCNEFWAYFNNYQTNLAVRKALGERPHICTDEGKITSQIQQTKERLQALAEQKQNLVKVEHQLQFALSQPVDSTVEIAEELLAKQQQLQIAKHKYQVATLTADILAQAKESLSSAYIPELCLRTEKLLNAVTGGNYKVVTNRNFAISLQENGQTKPLSAFSRGIKEITLLCFRIALSELLYGKDIPLLIVDDAFVNFDEQNFQRATQLLKQLSATTQVIYFTCHNRTGNL